VDIWALFQFHLVCWWAVGMQLVMKEAAREFREIVVFEVSCHVCQGTGDLSFCTAVKNQ
jgi:hypothetical protein